MAQTPPQRAGFEVGGIAPTPAGSGDAVILDEGGTIFGFAGIKNFSKAGVNLTLPTGIPSSVGMLFEFNILGVSDDYFQVGVAYNWPTCGSGVAAYYENWTNVGKIESISCQTSQPPSPGDRVSLQVSALPTCSSAFNGYVNLRVDDLTNPKDSSVYSMIIPNESVYSCETNYAFIPGEEPVLGYFTGPMTQLTDPSSTACERFSDLPMVSYYWSSGGAASVSQYQLWSAENVVDVTTSRTVTGCYYSGSGILGVASTPDTDFFDAAQGASEGPRWVAAQNTSASGGTPFWRFESDAVPYFVDNPTTLYIEPVNDQWGPAALLGPTAYVDLGEAYYVELNSAGSTGTNCLWWINGRQYDAANGQCGWSGTTTSGVTSTVGTFSINGYLFDEAGNGYPSNGFLIVDPAPSVGLTLTAGGVPTTSVEEGHSAILEAMAAGGSGLYLYGWSGLPTWCSTPNTLATMLPESLSCTPTSWGTFTVGVTVLDSNGFSPVSASLTINVPDPCGEGPPLESPHCNLLQFSGSGAWSVMLFCAVCHFVEALSPSNDSVPPLVTYDVPDGVYSYFVVGPPGYGVSNLPPVGNVTLNGSDVEMDLAFQRGLTTNLTFSSTGLEAGEEWCATVGSTSCSAGKTLTFPNLAPGRYPYELAPLAGSTERVREAGHAAGVSGWVVLRSPRHGATVSVEFHPVAYSLRFVETGLKKDAAWSVRVEGSVGGSPRTEVRRSSSDVIEFDLPNGTFNFTIHTSRAYLPTPAGSISVAGGPTTVAVSFAPTHLARGSASPNSLVPSAAHSSGPPERRFDHPAPAINLRGERGSRSTAHRPTPRLLRSEAWRG